MASFTFTGENASGYTRAGPYTFFTGEPVEVDDEEVIRRLSKHPEFEETKPRKKGKTKGSE